MRQFYENNGRRAFLFHTVSTKLLVFTRRDATHRRPLLQSGAGEIAEQADGEYATETVYSDVNVEQLKSIPGSAFHRNVDLAVITADEAGSSIATASAV